MPSREALEIAERYTPDCGGGLGLALRAGKVNGLARDIDELRVRDLEWCIKQFEDDQLLSGPESVYEQLAALRDAQRKDGAE